MFNVIRAPILTIFFPHFACSFKTCVQPATGQALFSGCQYFL